MRKPNKFLLLTANYGDGHNQVACAMQQTISAYGDRHVTVDLYREAFPALDSLCRSLYRKSPAFAEFGFDYYGWLYKMTHHMNRESNLLMKRLNSFGARKLATILGCEKPSAIVSTFPYGAVIERAQARCTVVPSFTIITDYTLHNRWLHGAQEHYFLATDELQRTLVKQGVPIERSTVSGIPIRPSFERVQGGVKMTGNHPTVLIMTGTYMPVTQTLTLIDALTRIPGLRINLVCGKNESLRLTLESRIGDVPGVSVFGFVEDMHELMSRAMPEQRKEPAFPLPRQGWLLAFILLPIRR